MMSFMSFYILKKTHIICLGRIQMLQNGKRKRFQTMMSFMSALLKIGQQMSVPKQPKKEEKE